MNKYKFTTQFNFDYENSDKHAHSDEIHTIPDDSFTVQQLMERALANTLPPLNDYYPDDDDGEDLSFEDELAFFQPSDFQELYDMQFSIGKRIEELESSEAERVAKSKLAQEEEQTKVDDTTIVE